MRNIYDFTDPTMRLPKEIVLDSSILLNLILMPPRERYGLELYNQIRFFLTRITQDKTCVAFAPFPALLECFHVISRNAINRYAVNNSLNGKPEDIHKRQPSVIEQANVLGLIERFLTKVKSLPITIIQPGQIRSTLFEEDVLFFVKKLELLTTDASIVAIANDYEINNIASVDSDFLRITRSNFNLYTAPRLL